jgi:hypothetical protein
MALPNDLDKRKKVVDALERGVALLNEISMLESDVLDLGTTLQDTEVMKAKDFKKLLAAKYEGQVLLQKAQEKVADVEDSLAAVDILAKIK